MRPAKPFFSARPWPGGWGWPWTWPRPAEGEEEEEEERLTNRFMSAVLCLMTSVPSFEGVMACSLSESSTSMVLADSVSPLLSLPALESSAPEVDSSPASWSTSSSSSSSVVPDSSLEEE